MAREKILIFVTGGTFDKEYNLITGELYFRNTHLHEMLRRGRCNLDVTIRTLMMVDSTEMTDEDRDLIIHNCRRSESESIVITHGTDRMVATAHAIAKANIAQKTIVITGAMIPYNFGTSSDGFYNLGAAMAFAQCLEPGVYVAMNGRYYNWDNVVKNTQTGYFEEIGEHEI